jgi:lipopolysaccharide export LptBFGC system permease protein LptF
MKKIGICLLGIILSFVLLSFFVYINLNFTEASEFAKGDYTEKVLNNSSENPFERLNKTIWRFDYLFIPIIVILISLLVCLMDKSKNRLFLSLIGILPLLIFYLFASTFSVRSFLFVISYILISVIVSLFFSRTQDVN